MCIQKQQWWAADESDEEVNLEETTGKMNQEVDSIVEVMHIKKCDQ